MFFYFKDSTNIEKMKDNLVFIGETEDYANDLKRLCKIIGIKNATPLLNRRNSSNRGKEARIKPSERNFYQSFFEEEYLLYNKLRGLKNFHA